MTLLQIHEPGQTPLPHGEGHAIGIDLGTTHSVIAISVDGIPTVLRDICGGALVPSVVYYGSDATLVGKEARARLLEGSPLAVSSIKRLMGGSQAEGMARLTLGGRSITPVEVSADILRHMKTLAETSLGREVTQAVITVPAYFNDSARQATKDAARLAGLSVLRLINEPTAAALAYGLDSGAEGIYAVYDLGGGTFDISILKMEKGVFQVLATGGDISLGGDDFDKALAERFLAANPMQADGATLKALEACARHAKEQLSDTQGAAIDFRGQSLAITRDDLHGLMGPFIKRSLAICAQALEDCGLAPQEIKGVVLVGGSTRSPFVRAQAEAFFGQGPLSGINPDEVVAVGAAIQAEGLTRGSDTLLLDVVPLSLGLETMGGMVEKIIHRNTPIPVAASQSFTTYQDNQTGLVVHVVQGEREMVDQNRSLARFELRAIPPLPAGIARVEVTFAVDADGLLGVSARELSTGVEQSVAVKPSYGLSEDEIERMLLESMQFARQDILQRLLVEAITEAKRSMEEVKSALKQDAGLTDKNEKTAIDAQMQKVAQAILGTDRDRIDFEVTALHEATRPFAERRMDRAIKSALQGANVNDITTAG